ncbi:hypothetical protein BCR44DRAFT_63890 [Catenaria anguillulae PL171]|uniref:Uncharacterized protein n=1 Tax=Catenaria anguillulae PL171 TaxID=765915 RepID=A0A1Y2HN54_9FUNG|nr:hypothetical protein BCR44DRAFT_63890 [Catenaria anguillulae PL171]
MDENGVCANRNSVSSLRWGAEPSHSPTLRSPVQHGHATHGAPVERVERNVKVRALHRTSFSAAVSKARKWGKEIQGNPTHHDKANVEVTVGRTLGTRFVDSRSLPAEWKRNQICAVGKRPVFWPTWLKQGNAAGTAHVRSKLADGQRQVGSAE